jgi:glycosyltransferase involved in cell wall biosynthesis
MRVAVFTDADFDRPNSATTTLAALLRHAPPDVRPRIYTLSDLDVDEPEYLALRSPGVPLQIEGWSPMHVPRIRELERRLASDDIRAIHLTTTGPAGLTARYLAHRTGLPLVGSIHTSLFPRFSDAAGGFGARWRGASVMPHYLRWLYGGCRKVLIPFADAAGRLTNVAWDAERLIVWPGGADAEAFSPARRSQRLRNEWHVSERRPAILCIGRLDGQSGVELMEPLGSLLHRQGIAHRFIVVGEGPAMAGLKESCPDAVFAGRLSHRDLATVMASADLLLWPGEVSTAGLVLLEAQASGLPVLAASGGNALEHMRPGHSGIVCRSDDLRGFCARASELLTDAGRRRNMGEAGRRFAQSRSWPASLERVYALYREASRPDASSVRVRPAPVTARAVRAQR